VLDDGAATGDTAAASSGGPGGEAGSWTATGEADPSGEGDSPGVPGEAGPCGESGSLMAVVSPAWPMHKGQSKRSHNPLLLGMLGTCTQGTRIPHVAGLDEL
jgi:hypothetical protein